MDLETALAFRKIKAGGFDFKKWGLIAPHPHFKNKKLTDVLLHDYTERFYKNNETELRNATLKFDRQWREIAPAFFKLTDDLFKQPFPRGKYICYPSIWNINPRDLNEKTFQIYYRSNQFTETATHEMLHFIFFDYVKNNFPKHEKSPKIWAVSEALNVLIQNQPRWRRILKTKKQRPYPLHKNLLKKMAKIWDKNKNLNNLLNSILKK